jgi:uncharacterized protein (TIGR02996 family)
MTSPHEASLLQSLAATPEDELAWQALADVREEQGDPRGPLLRLHLRVHQDWQDPRRDVWRQELSRLLCAGVKFDLPRLRNRLGMELALIPPGAFLMGSPPTRRGTHTTSSSTRWSSRGRSGWESTP